MALPVMTRGIQLSLLSQRPVPQSPAPSRPVNRPVATDCPICSGPMGGGRRARVCAVCGFGSTPRSDRPAPRRRQRMRLR